MKTTIIKAFDIPDAWFKCIEAVLTDGYEWTIQKGSYEGHKRKEFDNVLIAISNPSNRPMTPVDLPEGVPPPTSMKAVYDYLSVLMTPNRGNYQYTYGERIDPQINKAIEMLKKTPMTNQCCIEVGQPSDIALEHPPCLRLIDCRIRYGKLHFFVYFRSWDLWSGFPPNLGGLQLMKEWMASQVGVKDGTLNAWSKGLHLYDFQFDCANKLIYRKINMSGT